MKKDMKDKIHIFDTHFHSQLTLKTNPVGGMDDSERKHKTVSKWTRKIDIFSKQMIIFPICKDLHWFSILIIDPGAMTVRNVFSYPFLLKKIIFSDR